MKKLGLIVIVAVLPLIVVVGVYATFFSNYPFSSSGAEWGQFGDYFGGTLNPIYALLAFLGVLYTIHLQSEQLNLVRTQALLEEIQRLIFNISSEIDSLLKQPPKATPPEFGDRNHPFTIFSIISAIGTSVINNDSRAEIFKEKVLPCIKLEIGTLVIELQQLTTALEEYNANGGNKVIIDFYRKRYEVLVCWLEAIGGAKSSERVIEFFKPHNILSALKIVSNKES